MNTKYLMLMAMFGIMFSSLSFAATNPGNCTVNATTISTVPTLDLYANPTGTDQDLVVTWTLTKFYVLDNQTEAWIVFNGRTATQLGTVSVANAAGKVLNASVKLTTFGTNTNISWTENKNGPGGAILNASNSTEVTRIFSLTISDAQGAITTSTTTQKICRFNSSDLYGSITATVRCPLPERTYDTDQIWNVYTSSDGTTYTAKTGLSWTQGSDGKVDYIQDTASLSTVYYKIDKVTTSPGFKRTAAPTVQEPTGLQATMQSVLGPLGQPSPIANLPWGLILFFSAIAAVGAWAIFGKSK